MASIVPLNDFPQYLTSAANSLAQYSSKFPEEGTVEEWSLAMTGSDTGASDLKPLPPLSFIKPQVASYVLIDKGEYDGLLLMQWNKPEAVIKMLSTGKSPNFNTPNNLVSFYLPSLYVLAKNMECETLTFHARPGWRKFLHDFNEYKVILTKRL